MKIKLRYGKVYSETTKAFNSGSEVIIHKGGTGSGKTYETMMYNLFQEGLTVQNKVITVVAESMPHLKMGAIRYIDHFINIHNLHSIIKYHGTDKTYKIIPSGTVIEFFGADRLDKAIGARRYLLYGNEINSLKQPIWEELARRSERVIGDFNPTAKFWLEDWLQYYPKNCIIKSNYLDNIGCPQHEKERIELRAKKDLNFKRIHIDCEYGNAEDLVFKPETIVLIDQFPTDLKSSLGMDFGWTAPSTLTRVAINKDDVYIDEIFYKSQMNESDFVRELAPIDKRDKIVADSADQRMINYIYRNLGYNIHASKKGKDSVEFGLGFLQGKTIHITKNSINTIREFRNLTHAKDKFGNIIKGKYDGEDHSIDGVRYALEESLKPKNITSGGISF